jgi:hypothetical protein
MARELTPEGWLAKLEAERLATIDDAISVLEALKTNGHRASVRIETSVRGERGIEVFGEQTIWDFDVPEGPPKDPSA